MLSEDVKIRFRGFEPSHDVRSALDIILNQLHLKAPSQSFLSATFTLTNGIFEGVIKISSTAENFMAKASDVHLTDVGHKLMEKIGIDFDNWKANRF
ncbi:MAG TPA: hypothetical protein PKC28_03145 [Bdellovibrionales bacterium]|nr:hypothetical protein [Bdellovibrionales bacterium]